MSGLVPDVTPESHPDHHTVGKDFMGHSGKHGKSARWFCASHDACGYNMVNRADPENVINISERAIGRTFWEIYETPASHGYAAYEHSQWGPCRIDRAGNDIPPPPVTNDLHPSTAGISGPSPEESK